MSRSRIATAEPFGRLRLYSIVLGVFVVVNACGKSTPVPTIPTSSAATVNGVVVTSATASGASFQLTATAKMADGSSRDVTGAATWESSNPLLATVSSTGLVLVLGNGEIDVRATYQNVTG